MSVIHSYLDMDWSTKPKTYCIISTVMVKAGVVVYRVATV